MNVEKVNPPSPSGLERSQTVSTELDQQPDGVPGVNQASHMPEPLPMEPVPETSSDKHDRFQGETHEKQDNEVQAKQDPPEPLQTPKPLDTSNASPSQPAQAAPSSTQQQAMASGSQGASSTASRVDMLQVSVRGRDVRHSTSASSRARSHPPQTGGACGLRW